LTTVSPAGNCTFDQCHVRSRRRYYGEYLDAKKAGGTDWTHMEVFLSGIANGLESANIEFSSENLKPIFCSPIALNFDNINDVLEKEYSAKNMDWKPDSTVRSALLVGLKKMFPCR
jgi:hypothetical protein